MADQFGIKISRSGQDVISSLSNYLYQALSTKDALREKSSGVSSSNVAHGVTGGLPVILRFKIGGTDLADGSALSSSYVHSSSGTVISTTNFITTENCFYRIFYNKQTEV